MPQSAHYYPHLRLVVLRLSGVLNMASFAARMAEWMYAFDVPKGYVCLTDARALQAVDRPEQGTQELVAMQARVYHEVAAPEKSAILVDSPVGHVIGRLFEQLATGVLQEQVQVFRQERAAISFLGFRAEGLNALLSAQENVLEIT